MKERWVKNDDTLVVALRNERKKKIIYKNKTQRDGLEDSCCLRLGERERGKN